MADFIDEIRKFRGTNGDMLPDVSELTDDNTGIGVDGGSTEYGIRGQMKLFDNSVTTAKGTVDIFSEEMYGDGTPAAPAEGSVYKDIKDSKDSVDASETNMEEKYATIATTETNGNNGGMHGDIVAKHAELAITETNGNAGGKHGDMIAKHIDIVAKHTEVSVTEHNVQTNTGGTEAQEGKYGAVYAMHSDMFSSTTRNNNTVNGYHGDVLAKHTSTVTLEGQAEEHKNTAIASKDVSAEWANNPVGDDISVNAGEYSSLAMAKESKTYAQGLTGVDKTANDVALVGGSSREWATKTGGDVVTGEQSAKAHSILSGESAELSEASNVKADKWANEVVNTEVEPGKYSAKSWSSKSNEWAEKDVGEEVEAGKYSAKHWADVAINAVGQGIIDDDSISLYTTYSSNKIDLLNTSVQEAIAGLATAQGEIVSVAAINPIGTVERAMPFSIESASSNSDIFELDATNDRMIFKADVGITFMSSVTLRNTNNQPENETITVRILNDADDTLLSETSFEITIPASESETLPMNTLLSIGKGAVPSTETENLITKMTVQSNGTAFELTNFNSIIASSSSYDLTVVADNVVLVPDGNLTSDNVQDGMIELQADIDIRTKRETFKNKTAAYAMMDRDYIFADTSAGAFTMSLPGSPIIGAQVSVLDVAATFDSNNLTIERNGNTIMGVADNMLLDLENSFTKFIYTGSDWRLQ